MQESTAQEIAPPAARRRPWVTSLRRRIPLLVFLALLGGGGFAFWRYEATRPPPAVHYRTAQVAKKAIVGRVTASGTLSAIVTVQVGTQVSGRIQKLFVDFNSPVKKGEPVAKIDPQLFQAAADQAQANYLAATAAVAKAQSDLHIAQIQLDRTRALHDQNLAAQQDLDNAAAAADGAKATLDAQKASLAQAVAQRHQAEVNLSYTNIVSPIDGVVISRTVDVGQTVAASLQAPTIFTIAQDLTKMQVDTNVAEADVGRLQVGMATYFTVDAFPGQRFKGKIREIRNAAIMLQNVVTYDAVIEVDNSDLKLRPGMTANVTVIYDERKDALALPNAALRFHPPASAADSGGGASSASAASGGPGSRGGGGGHHGGGSKGDDASAPQTIYVMKGGSPQPVPIHVGLTDGTVTEVVDGDVHEGDEVALEVLDAAAAKDSPASTSTGRRLF
jgi:HlyD family secretion protein